MKNPSPIQEFLEGGAVRFHPTWRPNQQVLQIWIAVLTFSTASVCLVTFPKIVVASDIPGVDAPRQESSYYRRRNPQNEVSHQHEIATESLNMETGNNVEKPTEVLETKAQKIKKVCEWQKQQGRQLGNYCNTLSISQEGPNRPMQEKVSRHNPEPDAWDNDQMEQLFMKGGKDPWADEMFLSPEQKQQRAEERRLILEEQAKETAYKHRMQELAIEAKKEDMESKKEEANQRQIAIETQKAQKEEELALRKEEMELQRQDQNQRHMLDTLNTINSFNKNLYPGLR